MNPCFDLLSCLISAFEFLQIPQPGDGPFAVVVRDKPGHHVVFVSIQLESCRIRALISCSHNSALVGCQGIKVTSKPGRPVGLCSSEDRDQLCCMVELVVSALVLQLGLSIFGSFRKERCN